MPRAVILRGYHTGKGRPLKTAEPPPGGESQPTTKYAIRYLDNMRRYIHSLPLMEEAAENEWVYFQSTPELLVVEMRTASGTMTEILPGSPGQFGFYMPAEDVDLRPLKCAVGAHINNIPVFPAGNNVAYIVPETAYSPGLDWTQIEGISFRHENVYGPSYNAFVMPGEMIIVFTGPDNPPQEIKLFRIPYEGGIPDVFLDYNTMGMTLYSHP